MLQVHVRGGTNAGFRVINLQTRTSWTCSEGHGPNAHYWRNCPVCGEPRPDLRKV